MNTAMEQQVDNTLSMEGSSTDIWEDLSKIYLMAIDRHIPPRVAKPSRPWISEATLQLLERRSQLRMQGDLDQVAELHREIREGLLNAINVSGWMSSSKQEIGAPSLISENLSVNRSLL